MSAQEALKFVLSILALVLATPVAMLIIRVSVFLSSLKSAVEAGAGTLRHTVKRVDDNDRSIADLDVRVSVLEERHPPINLTKRAGDIV